jgi:diadenosine tetraphosphate (Ap4A) HIT family hydrolase
MFLKQKYNLKNTLKKNRINYKINVFSYKKRSAEHFTKHVQPRKQALI